ncbi:zeta toxin family protein [Streptomyces sp. NPDC085639]|uniref:zeta toxin family protein n=1 Tax=Streptomyces sp. NPDC085639 TaxID=3365734 RepID=UPI0037D86AF6
MRSDDRTAGVRTRPGVMRWQAEVETYTRSRRFDVVLEEPVADMEEAGAKASSYRADGYRVERWRWPRRKPRHSSAGWTATCCRWTRRVWAGPCPGATWSSARATCPCPCSWRPVEAQRLADQVMVVRRGRGRGRRGDAASCSSRSRPRHGCGSNPARLTEHAVGPDWGGCAANPVTRRGQRAPIGPWPALLDDSQRGDEAGYRRHSRCTRDVVVSGAGLSLRVRRHGEHERIVEPSFAQKAST